MAAFNFTPASREEIKVKVCIFGASGSGKTTGALAVAYGLCGDWRRVAFADSEGDSAKQACGMTYGSGADAFTVPQGAESFRHHSVKPPYSTEMLVELLDHVVSARDSDGRQTFDVLVIESLSHWWTGAGGVLEQVDKGKGFEAWKVQTPRLRAMVDAIRFAAIHVVFTLRASTEYEITTTTTPEGRKKVAGIEKVGVKPEFRPGIDYEATVGFAVNADHLSRCDKDRSHLFVDREPRRLTPADGRALREWSEGAVCQIGSDAWVKLRIAELDSYAGSIEGLAAIWKSVAGLGPRIKREDWAAMVAAKDASKARLQQKGA